MRTKLLLSIFIVLLQNILITSYANAEPRNVLLEFCTGTWCIHCIGGHTTAHQIDSIYPNTVILAYHGRRDDPFQYFNGNAVRVLLGFQGYPTGIIDRMNHPGNSGKPYSDVNYDQWMGRVQTRYANSPMTDVNINVVSISYNPSTRELKAIVKTIALQNLNGFFMLQYVLTENGIIYYQTGGGPYYVHDLVVRDMINGEIGETIVSGTWNQNATFRDTLITTLNPSWVWNNCSLNIFVYRDSTGQLFHSTVQQATDTSLSDVIGIKNINSIPEEFSLSQNYPNPFNPKTNIHFSIPKREKVSLKIYNIIGREIAVCYDDYLNAGKYNVEFDGSSLSSGLYFYKLTANDFVDVKKMVLLK